MEPIYQYQLSLGGIILGFRSSYPIGINPELEDFISDQIPDVTFDILEEWSEPPLGSWLGEDMLVEYYQQEAKFLCVSKKDRNGVPMYTLMDEKNYIYVNKKAYQGIPYHLGWILRQLPIRKILLERKTLFFHSSHISMGDSGIIFTAPSGTGKTTQAKLWELHRGAERICNDRTLIRKIDGRWCGFSYPLDGSEPVKSTKVTRVKAIVLLSQAMENRIEPLKPAIAVASLMPQLVMDGWWAKARILAAEQLMHLISELPVYHLACTPDERAIDCLEQQLRKDGISL